MHRQRDGNINVGVFWEDMRILRKKASKKGDFAPITRGTPDYEEEGNS